MDAVLPDDLMVKIFRYLNLEQDQKAISLVCKRWLSLERLSLQTILVRFTGGTDALLKLVAGRYTNVCSVSIDESPWTYIGHKPVYGEMGLICRFPRITEPCAIEERKMYCLTDAGLAAVGEYFAKLERLRLISCSNITDVGLISLSEKCKLLKSLALEIGYEQIICIGENCKSLTHLHLPYCSRITNTEIQAIARAFPQLSCLDISGLQTQDTGILAVSEGFPFLKDLKINNCPNLTDSSLTYIAENCTLLESCSLNLCPGITKFRVEDFVRRCRNIKEIWGEKWKLSNP